MNVMMVFHKPVVLGGALYFTAERNPNEYDRGRWEGEGYRVIFLRVDPENQTAEVLKVGA